MKLLIGSSSIFPYWTMRSELTPDIIGERLCWRLQIPLYDIPHNFTAIIAQFSSPRVPNNNIRLYTQSTLR